MILLTPQTLLFSGFILVSTYTNSFGLLPHVAEFESLNVTVTFCDVPASITWFTDCDANFAHNMSSGQSCEYAVCEKKKTVISAENATIVVLTLFKVTPLGYD